MHFESIDRDDFCRTKNVLRKYNIEWKHYAGRDVIGDCSNLFQRLQPTDYYDFYLKYTKDGEDTIGNRKKMKFYGRTEEEIENIAKMYRDTCGDYSIPLEDYIKNIYTHTLIETFDGQMSEQKVNQLLTNLGYTYEKPQGNEDSKYGIDFKVYKNNILQFVLQIKPISFFKGVKNESLIRDRKNAFDKQELVWKKFNVPTYYMIYNAVKNGEIRWISENNKLCFELSSLCNRENGIPYALSKEYKVF